IGQRRPSQKPEIHVPGAGRDVAEHVLHLSTEPEPDGNRVYLINRLGRVRRLLQNDLPQGQCKFGNVGVVRFEEPEELTMRGALHAATDHTRKSAGWSLTSACDI